MEDKRPLEEIGEETPVVEETVEETVQKPEELKVATRDWVMKTTDTALMPRRTKEFPWTDYETGKTMLIRVEYAVIRNKDFQDIQSDSLEFHDDKMKLKRFNLGHFTNTILVRSIKQGPFPIGLKYFEAADPMFIQELSQDIIPSPSIGGEEVEGK